MFVTIIITELLFIELINLAGNEFIYMQIFNVT